MQFKSERDLEDLLYRDWPTIRAQDRLAACLPGCTTRQWVHPDRGTLGYVTLDYQLHRQLGVPGAAVGGNTGVADLVEHYWSLRTCDGIQEADWPVSLNIHAIELKNEPLTVAHCQQVYRYALALRGAAAVSLREASADPDHLPEVHVRAVLLGPEISRDAAVVHAMASRLDLPLFLTRFQVSAIDGITFSEPEDAERFWQVGINDVDALAALGQRCFASSPLLTTGGHWEGVNDGPVFDATTGLTIHNGRVL